MSFEDPGNEVDFKAGTRTWRGLQITRGLYYFAQLLLVFDKGNSFSLCRYESGKPEQSGIVFLSAPKAPCKLYRPGDFPSSLWLFGSPQVKFEECCFV